MGPATLDAGRPAGFQLHLCPGTRRRLIQLNRPNRLDRLDRLNRLNPDPSLIDDRSVDISPFADDEGLARTRPCWSQIEVNSHASFFLLFFSFIFPFPATYFTYLFCFQVSEIVLPNATQLCDIMKYPFVVACTKPGFIFILLFFSLYFLFHRGAAGPGNSLLAKSGVRNSSSLSTLHYSYTFLFFFFLFPFHLFLFFPPFFSMGSWSRSREGRVQDGYLTYLIMVWLQMTGMRE